MKSANHQPQFLPYLGFFHKAAHADVVVLMDDVLFMDRHFQHRNNIKHQGGTLLLTVPVVKNRGQLIKDVQLAPVPWRRKMWASLKSSYGHAPHWKEFAPSLEAILAEGTQTDLVSLDVDLRRWAFGILSIDRSMHLASELSLPATRGPSEAHCAMCKAVGADTYLSGPGGRDYMDMVVFEREGIAVEFQQYAAKEYPQLYPQHGFIANLAVIDAIFNVGRDARALIGLPL